MKDDVVIRLENVNKTFKIREKSADSIFKKVKRFFGGKGGLREIKALKNINLEVRRGEFLGIIGHNGSGKSTLLKIILGVIPPDPEGKIETKGKVVRLALGMGFDPELSARDNIYINGSILGLTFKQIGEKFWGILEFAGLKDFVDTPIKFFSSGMYSRLAFAIAMYVDADILLIDEFFGGVGDQEFQKKSAEVFQDVILQGKTILFVSHNKDLINKYSSRTIELSNGIILSKIP